MICDCVDCLARSNLFLVLIRKGVSHLNDSMHEDVFFETIEPKLSQVCFFM